MRTIPTFVSVLAVIWAAASCVRASGLGWPIPAYVIGQCFFVLSAWLSLQKWLPGDTHYRWLFNLSFFAVLGLALTATARFLAVFPPALAAFVFLAGLFSVCATAAVVYWRLLEIYTDRVPQALAATVLQASILTFCGSSTLLTLFAPAKAEVCISATALGTFWFLMGAFFFAYCIGIVRMHTAWARLDYYFPAMLAIASFGWMAWQLGSLRAQPVAEFVTQTVQP